MGHPTAKELMQVAAAVGLAQNFSALKSLVTTGIQKGHMKMHLLNILQSLGADKKQIELAKEFFKDRVISFRAVREFLISLSKAENHLDKNHGI
jgi:hydroxymethylglutaryl-CoA reductase